MMYFTCEVGEGDEKETAVFRMRGLLDAERFVSGKWMPAGGAWTDRLARYNLTGYPDDIEGFENPPAGIPA